MTTVPAHCITLEEHAIFPSLGDDTPFYDEIAETFPSVRVALRDMDDKRLSDMDAGHVSMQVMSHLPGMANLQPAAASSAANDEMGAAVQAHPTRYRGLACLPMHDPAAAAAELERVMTATHLQGAFVGAMVDNVLPDGITHYDGRAYDGLWGALCRHDVPVYLHPAPPPEATYTRPGHRFFGDYPRLVAQGVATGAWGWHENVGLAVVKMYAAGVFDRFPALKVVIGHMGEMLPLWVDRIDDLTFFRRAGLSSFAEVYHRNIWVTSSGIFGTKTLEAVLKITKMDRVMYSVDTPFKKSPQGWKFIEEIAEKGILSSEDLEAFAWGNAKRFLKLP